jgi:hypothetical protein
VFTVDPMSISEKQDKMIKTVIDRVISRVTVQTQQIELLKMQLEFNRSQLQQAQANGQEGQMQDPAQMINMQRMEMQLRALEDVTERARQVFMEEMSKAQKYYKYSYRTALEVAVSTGLRWWIEHYSMSELFLDGFDDLFITDNEVYYIHDSMEGSDPKVSRVSPLDYFYPAQDGIRYLDELDWGMHVKWMSPSQIVQNYPGLSEDTISKLKEGNMDMFASSMQYRRAYAGRDYTRPRVRRTIPMVSTPRCRTRDHPLCPMPYRSTIPFGASGRKSAWKSWSKPVLPVTWFAMSSSSRVRSRRVGT